MEIVVTAEQNPDKYVLRLRDGEKKKVSIDFSPWVEANEPIISVDWNGAHEDLVLDENYLTVVVTKEGYHKVTVTTSNLVLKLCLEIGRGKYCYGYAY